MFKLNEYILSIYCKQVSIVLTMKYVSMTRKLRKSLNLLKMMVINIIVTTLSVVFGLLDVCVVCIFESNQSHEQMILFCMMEISVLNNLVNLIASYDVTVENQYTILLNQCGEIPYQLHFTVWRNVNKNFRGFRSFGALKQIQI